MTVAAASPSTAPLPFALMAAPAVILVLVAWLGRRYLVQHRAAVGVAVLLAVANTVPTVTASYAGLKPIFLRGILAVDGLLVFAASTAVRDAWRHTRDRRRGQDPPVR